MQIYSSPEQLLQEFDKLVPASPLRDHSLAVARGCAELGGEVLWAAGLLHDIGKALPGDFHPLDGARFVLYLGEPDLAHLVARHSTSPAEARLRDISLHPWGRCKWPREQAMLDAIDLTTSPSGEQVSLVERKRDIASRYDAFSPEVLSLEMISPLQMEYIALREGS